MHRTRAVYYEGPPLPQENNVFESNSHSVAGDPTLARRARQLRAQLRRAKLQATMVASATHSAVASRKPDTSAPLCCDGQPTCNNGGTGANAPALYRFELPPLATDGGPRFSGLGELLGEFETVYPPQLCGGMSTGAVQAMPTTCTSIADTMPNRAVFLSQYKRGRATHMIFVSRTSNDASFALVLHICSMQMADTPSNAQCSSQNVTHTVRRAYFFNDSACSNEGLVGQYDMVGKQPGYQVAMLQDFFWVTNNDGKPLYRSLAKYWP